MPSLLCSFCGSSRRKINCTRRAEKISVGIINVEALLRSAHARRATASSLVLLFAVPERFYRIGRHTKFQEHLTINFGVTRNNSD